MRRRRLVLAVPTAAALFALCAAPALAQPVTTPVPGPVSPGQPPVSAPNGPQSLAHAVGDAGTGLAVVRLAPESTTTNTILPGFGEELPKQSAAELGVGLASAQVNTEAYLAFERSVAQASPLGFAVQGRAPQTPGSLAQTASPDNAAGLSGGLALPKTPLDALLTVKGLEGAVHARWDDRLGPCVQPLSEAKTSLASLSVLNAIPTLPSSPDLTGMLTQDTPKLDAAAKQSLIDGLKGLTAPLSQLGGLLSGTADTGEKGSLLSLPETMAARSSVELVDLPDSANKAVKTTSTLQAASVRLLAGTPMEVRIDVVSQPTLVALATGVEATSTITYTAPVLRVTQGGKVLGTLDAANPKLEIPIGIPIAGLPELPKLPIIGGILPNGGDVPAELKKLDIGVLRLQIAQFNEKKQALNGPLTQGGPTIKGFMLGATARLLDLQLLPTDALGLPNLPSALAQVSLGEQIVRAAAPEGGVVCGTTTPPAGAQPPPPGQPRPTIPLAYTTAAYKTIPIFWLGTALLLAGVVIVSAMPGARRREPALVGATEVVTATEPEAEPEDVAEPDNTEPEVTEPEDVAEPEAEPEVAEPEDVTEPEADPKPKTED
ncbi:hypothetical protein ACFFQW_33320 [Umezawaea endophytica]|uniref:Choice-of-anchor G family protein n=1 Tax=Umezawaea endophytica TaxID=1654476 RepID=A0A9X2VXY6_9PSEU|nr:hypothetical protein [Umezawaea endophytica]MCS7484252.1 hypothetical protein [Umezawaea endophytica]